MQRKGSLIVIIIVVVLFVVVTHNMNNGNGSSTASATEDSSKNPYDVNTPNYTDNGSTVGNQNDTSQPTAIPTDRASTSYDYLPDTGYYCNRIHYLGGKFPKHLYIGHCLIQKIEQYSWTVSEIASVISDTLCEENFVCSTIVSALAKFIKHEIDHLYDEDNQCGQNGIYVHWFNVFFRTHAVC